MIVCDICKARDCQKQEHDKPHTNCPMNDQAFYDGIKPDYMTDDVHSFFVSCAEIEAEGYRHWTRLREIVELCRKMDFKKVGIAFCVGLSREAEVVSSILRENGVEVASACCKNGGIPKEEIGIPKEGKISPDDYEVMCNPIAQAKLLNREKTDFNVVIGLCVGHDSLFFKNSDAYATTLIAKDRVLAHNPAGAIYCRDSYLKF